MGPSLKVEVDSERWVGSHHQNLVIKGTRRGRLSGYWGMRWLSGQKSLLRERISKHNRLRSSWSGRDSRGGVLSPHGGLRLPHLPHLW